MASCLLAVLALARPGTAWLREPPAAAELGAPAFRSDATATLGSGPGVASLLAAQAAASSTDQLGARSSQGPGFRSRSKPFDPEIANQPLSTSIPFGAGGGGGDSESWAVSTRDAVSTARTFRDPESVPDVTGALAQLEISYQLALATMGVSGGARGAQAPPNPFEQALQSTNIPAEPSGGGEPEDGTPTTSSEPGAGEGEAPPEPGEPTPDVPPTDTGGASPAMDFLVTGVTGDVQRAFQREDGVFVLEDNSRLKLFGGATFGFSRPSLLFDERDQMVVADVDGDGRMDVVRAREQFLGTTVEVLLQKGSGFEFAAGGVFRFDSVVSLALYDWDGDGDVEIALVTQARPNLLFYEIRGTELVYEREVVLGFKPAALVDISVWNSDERRLLMLPEDPALFAGRYLSTRFGLGTQIPFEPRVSSVQLEGPGAPRVTMLRKENRLVLLGADQGRVRLIGSLERRDASPLTVYGRHSREGTWELMYLP